jgi:hypothetical protein
MLASVAFVTQLLGLAAGEQPVEIRADSIVARVELRRDGQTVASMTKAPWKTVVDLGADLLPFELTAHAFDAGGREQGTDSQTVNLPRPPAEVQILLDRRDGRIFATLQWQHLLGATPKKARLAMDGRIVSERATAGPVELPFVAPDAIHSLSAEVEFPGHVVARKETVFGGVYSELVPVELTPVIVRDGTERCDFRGRSIEPAALARGEATVEFIFNGRPGRAAHLVEMRLTDSRFVFDGTELRVASPVAEPFRARESVRTDIFPSERVAANPEIRRLMRAAAVIPRGKAQTADAVAAAAVRRLAAGRRGAVVLVLGDQAADDRSTLSPAAVRQYCETIGVPLHVWSFIGATPALRDAWGDVTDISTTPGISGAIVELRRDLDSQRVAWLPLARLDAVRADCGRP